MPKIPEPTKIAKSILWKRPDIDAADFVSLLKKKPNINAFAVERLKLMLEILRKEILEKKRKATEKRFLTKSQKKVLLYRLPEFSEERYSDAQIFEFLNRNLNLDLAEIRYRLYENQIIINTKTLERLFKNFQTMRDNNLFSSISIPDLEKFFVALPNMFSKYKTKEMSKIRIRIFSIFIQFLNGRVNGNSFFATKRFVDFKEFKQKIKSELGIKEAYVNELIKDFIEAGIFQLVLNGKYLMIPVQLASKRN